MQIVHPIYIRSVKSGIDENAGWTQPMNPTYEPHLWMSEIRRVPPMNVTKYVPPMNMATYERQKF